MLIKDSAICLRTVDYSETSQIVSLFARTTGKISAIAKGSKRPKSAFDGPIDIFSYGEIVFSDSSREKLTTLTEFEQQPAFTLMGTNQLSLNASLFAVELIDSLINEYDPHPELFDSFLQFLKNTNEIRDTLGASRDTLTLLILFQLSLLKEIGLQPILNACVNCKSKYGSNWPQCYFSNSANGLLCRDCEAGFQDKIKLNQSTANCLADLKTIGKADEKTLQQIEKVLINHFTEILNRPPKMAKYILSS